VGTLDSESKEGLCPMESLAALRQPHADRRPHVRLLLADDDAGLRSLMAARAYAIADALVVVEASDGAEAIQIGLQRQPQVALIDVDMPRLGGIAVAMTLRELRPQMRLALHTADPLAYGDRARECRLPLFDKLELDGVVDWLERQTQSFVEPSALRQRRSLECSACRYGIVRSVPPSRCPMCQREDTWIHSPWRPYAVDRGFA
jgi:CheY-like chemotaxis protein